MSLDNHSSFACDDKFPFFTSDYQKRFKLWSYQKVWDALIYLLDNIFFKFDTNLHRQVVRIPIGTGGGRVVRMC